MALVLTVFLILLLCTSEMYFENVDPTMNMMPFPSFSGSYYLEYINGGGGDSGQRL